MELEEETDNILLACVWPNQEARNLEK